MFTYLLTYIIQECDEQTDRQTNTSRQHIPRYAHASHMRRAVKTERARKVRL